MLARLARMDPARVRPIRHRSEEAQKDLMTIESRPHWWKRTGLVNAARGLTRRSWRCRRVTPTSWTRRKLGALPADLRER